MLLDRLRVYLQPSFERQSESFPEGPATEPALTPCLIAVRWPVVHEDAQFKADAVFFAVDEFWASRAPQRATTYTVAEIEAIGGLNTAVIRLLHVAKRAGRTILETSQPVHRSLLDVMKDVGATAIDV